MSVHDSKLHSLPITPHVHKAGVNVISMYRTEKLLHLVVSFSVDSRILVQEQIQPF